MTHSEHLFAPYIRILGKGRKGSRSLTQEEAFDAMSLILDNQVEELQLGAFLMLLRVKEETPEELAGFIQAARDVIAITPPATTIDLDWSSYAGKRRHLPWFLLAVRLLTDNGVTVFMHGAKGHTEGRIYTQELLHAVGLPEANSLEQAQQQLTQNRFSYLSLEYFCPKLADIINLRPILGLRSPVHTLARMLNPFSATASIQGIFHPSYRPTHQEAALILNDPHVAVIKGEGGEIERNPDVPCLVQSVHHSQRFDEQWPALFSKRHRKPDTLDPQQLADLWQGAFSDEYAEATIIGTTAITLKVIGLASSQSDAENKAKTWWENRKEVMIT
ncbi:MAG: glycosyl transferase family protein [Methylococcales bacterium]|jgi:anthranilate phosphoribosyltransferase|nr:glycosyl transferase family protein [Methylococcales bacterium]